MNRILSSARIVATSLLAMLALIIAGCSKDANPVTPDNNNQNSSGPGAGTSWTMSGVSTDVQGRVVQSNDVTTVVAETKLTVGGRNNAVKILTGGNGYTYYIYESNGDLRQLLYLTNSGKVLDSAWVLMPIASMGTSLLPNWDETDAGERVTSSGSFAYLGEATVTEAGETFATKKLLSTGNIALLSSNGDTVLRQSRVDTIWYAPRIFNIVKSRGSQINHSPFGDELYYNNSDLKSYHLN